MIGVDGKWVTTFGLVNCSRLSLYRHYAMRSGDATPLRRACAFKYCASLPSVYVPESVVSLGAEAFAGCSSLTSLTIGSHRLSWALLACRLRRQRVNEAAGTLDAFCMALRDVRTRQTVVAYIPRYSALEKVGNDAFRGCPLGSIPCDHLTLAHR